MLKTRAIIVGLKCNQLIILYPQTTASFNNPKACWDWWGYTDEHFADRSGTQIQSVWNMAQALRASR